jgi:hypothetical protein
VSRIERDILHHRDDVSECARHLNTSLERARTRSLRLAKECLSAADRITETLQTHHRMRMHSMIPPRIRQLLSRMEKDDLLLILDTLSFEESVRQYLLYRFPPGADDPFSEGNV